MPNFNKFEKNKKNTCFFCFYLLEYPMHVMK